MEAQGAGLVGGSSGWCTKSGAWEATGRALLVGESPWPATPTVSVGYP